MITEIAGYSVPLSETVWKEPRLKSAISSAKTKEEQELNRRSTTIHSPAEFSFQTMKKGMHRFTQKK